MRLNFLHGDGGQRPPWIASPSDASWNPVAKLFHWFVAALIFSQFALGWLAVGWRLSPTKLDLFVWHKSTGMLVLALVLARLLWRLAHGAPPLPAGTPTWERAAAGASHVLLYVMMIAMPLSGWFLNSAAGVPFSVFRRIPLPAIASADKATADVAALVHFSLFVGFALLLVVHIAAALRHHFVKHDDVLVRMWPGRTTRP